MNFDLSNDQLEILDAIESFAAKDKVLNSTEFEDDESARFSTEKWSRCCATGILGLPVPKEYGGLGETMLTTALAVKMLSRHCPDEGMVFSLCAHLCTGMIPILVHGSHEQKSKYLPRMIAGEYIGGNGSTEADSGSDISVMKLKAEKCDGGYRLNGSKIFVTNGSIADILIIYARHSNGIKYADISAFIVETANVGFEVGQVWSKMGLRTSPLSEIVLNECFVEDKALLGRERRGFSTFNDSMIWERIIMPAYHLGAMERQYNAALSYAKTRRQFDQNIIQFQAVSEKLVAMKRNIDTATPLLYQTCWKYANNSLTVADASMLKLHVSSGKVENSLNAIQIFGASGYMKGSPVEKQLRDSISSTIYSGTSEIQKRLITDAMMEYQ